MNARHRLVMFPLLRQHGAEPAIALRVPGPNLQGLTVASGRFLQPIEVHEGKAQVVQSACMTRVQRQRLSQTRLRFGGLPLVGQHRSQAVISVDVIGPQLQRPSVTGRRTSKLSLLLQHFAQVVVGFRIVRLQPQHS